MLTYAQVSNDPVPPTASLAQVLSLLSLPAQKYKYCPQYFWYKRTNTDVPPTAELTQIRQTVVEQLILPLGSLPVHQKAPYVNKALLYGPAGTGKTRV
jgi:hypothetical protein